MTSRQRNFLLGLTCALATTVAATSLASSVARERAIGHAAAGGGSCGAGGGSGCGGGCGESGGGQAVGIPGPGFVDMGSLDAPVQVLAVVSPGAAGSAETAAALSEVAGRYPKGVHVALRPPGHPEAQAAPREGPGVWLRSSKGEGEEPRYKELGAGIADTNPIVTAVEAALTEAGATPEPAAPAAAGTGETCTRGESCGAPHEGCDLKPEGAEGTCPLHPGADAEKPAKHSAASEV